METTDLLSKADFKLSLNIDSKKYIELNQFGLVVGYIEFDEIFDGCYWFNDVLDREEYDLLFPDNKFVLLETLYIDSNLRGNGLGNMMMRYFNKFDKKFFPDFDKFVLNAYPMEESIPLEALTGFYSKCGFRELIHGDNNCIMIRD